MRFYFEISYPSSKTIKKIYVPVHSLLDILSMSNRQSSLPGRTFSWHVVTFVPAAPTKESIDQFDSQTEWQRDDSSFQNQNTMDRRVYTRHRERHDAEALGHPAELAERWSSSCWPQYRIKYRNDGYAVPLHIWYPCSSYEMINALFSYQAQRTCPRQCFLAADPTKL